MSHRLLISDGFSAKLATQIGFVGVVRGLRSTLSICPTRNGVPGSGQVPATSPSCQYRVFAARDIG